MANSLLTRILFARVGTDSLRNRLVRGATGAFGLNIAATGLFFFISVFLARLLGVADYGGYIYVMAWVGLLGVPAILGLSSLLTRAVAVYETQSAWGLMSGLLRWANRTVLVVSLGLALLAAGAAGILAEYFEPQILLTFWLALFILPLRALMGLRLATMRGLHHVVTGQLPERIIQPLLLIAFVGGAYLFLGKGLNPPWVVGMSAIATGVAFLIGTLLLLKIIPQALKEASPVYETRTWARSALPLLFISGVYVINNRTDILMLGAIQGTELVGLYNVANRGALLVVFVLLAVNAALGPTIASLYAKGDINRLQRVITKSARVIFFASLPIVVGLIIFGHWFLLIFGQEFTQGQAALTILSASQLVNAATGSVSLLLIMTGHERDVAVSVGISAMVNIILNAILIPLWGVEGAAAATASSRVIWNLLLVVLAYKRLGIYSTALGKISLRREA